VFVEHITMTFPLADFVNCERKKAWFLLCK
jgi:hypothetical protein